MIFILFGDGNFELRKYNSFTRTQFVLRVATEEAQGLAAPWNVPVRTEVIASLKTLGVIALRVGSEKSVLTPVLLTFYGVTIAPIHVQIVSTEVGVIASMDPASASPGLLAKYVKKNVKSVSGVMDVLVLVIVHLMWLVIPKMELVSVTSSSPDPDVKCWIVRKTCLVRIVFTAAGARTMRPVTISMGFVTVRVRGTRGHTATTVWRSLTLHVQFNFESHFHTFVNKNQIFYSYTIITNINSQDWFTLQMR